MSDRIVNFLYELARESRKKNKKLHTFSAIVLRGNIISIGQNSFKTDPFQLRFGKNSASIYLHAEILAIKRALKILDIDTLKKCDIYVVRAKSGGMGLAKPCDGCKRAIETFELRKVYYSEG